jgi:hypothetical protein
MSSHEIPSLADIPLWKRLPRRAVSAVEAVAVLPDAELVGRLAVYASLHRDVYDADDSRFSHLLVETEHTYFDLGLSFDGYGTNWSVAVREPKEAVTAPGPEFGYFAARKAAEQLSFTTEEIHSYEGEMGSCLWRIGGVKLRRGRVVQRGSTSVSLDDERVAELRERRPSWGGQHE